MPEDKPITTLDEAAEFNKFKEWWFSIYPSTINPVLVYDHIEKYFKPQWQSQQKETKPTGLRKLIDIRNKFYHNLPTRDIKSWDLLQHIKSHLKDIDNYINQHTTTSEETEETKPVEDKADIIAGIITDYEDSKDCIPKGLNHAEYQIAHTKALRDVYDRNISTQKPVSEEGEVIDINLLPKPPITNK